MDFDKETQSKINARRKKILQDRYDYLYKKNTTKKELREMGMLRKRIEKL